MSNLTLAISVPGIIAFIAVMIPNFVYMILAPKEQLEGNRKESYMNGENLSRDFFVFFLVAFSSQEKASIICLIVSMVFLLLYYFTWFRYFKNGKKDEDRFSPLLFVPVPLAIFPILFFIFVSLYLNNTLALSLCILFAFFHIKGALKEAKRIREGKNEGQ